MTDVACAGQESTTKSWSERLYCFLFNPVDISFLVFFRILMGLAMLWVLHGFYQYDLGSSLANRPFRFSYHGFGWIKPWSASGMQVHFAILAFFAVTLLLGLFYRLSAFVLCLGFTYVFLLEKADYLNHYYLVSLLLFLLIFLPANRACSLDAWFRPSIQSSTVPGWTLWLLRFQIGLPYFHGGLSKLHLDWLCGQPMQMWLAKSPWRAVVGPMAAEHWFAMFFSWGGLLFDLLVVPLLLWKPTRAFAFTIAIAFHLMNAFMFDIGVFPWLMIGATLVFFPPDWPRRLLDSDRPKPSEDPTQTIGVESAPTWSRRQKLVLVSLLVYTGFHLLVPFRHFLYPGNVLWNEEGHRFAWQMMLRTKITGLKFLVVDSKTRKQIPVSLDRWLNPWQYNKMSRDPEMIREFAQFLREEYQRTGQEVEVHVFALSSLNGRKPQLLIEPTVDLSRQPRTLLSQPWICPLTEPFRWDPWQHSFDTPLEESHSEEQNRATYPGTSR